MGWYRIFDHKNLSESLNIINPDVIVIDNLFNSLLVDNGTMVGNTNFQEGLYNLPRKEFFSYLTKYDLKGSYISKYYGKVDIYKEKTR